MRFMVLRLPDIALLYESEQVRLWRLVQRIVRNRSTSEDLVQDSFVKLMKAAQENGIADPRAYLARIARNLAIDHRRHQQRLLFESTAEKELFSFVDPAPSPETIVADRQALALTLDVIAAMPARKRTAFEMHRLHGLTLMQIAKKLGISTSLAGKLVLDAYGLVRARLRESGDI